MKNKNELFLFKNFMCIYKGSKVNNTEVISGGVKEKFNYGKDMDRVHADDILFLNLEFS